MRDLFFLAMLPLMLYAMAKRPFIALGMWIWTAMFFPNAWLYGIGAGIRYSLLFTAVAILGYLALKDKSKVHLGSIGVFVLLFFAWSVISTMNTMGRPEIAWDIWIRFSKVVLLFIFIILIVEKKLHIDFFLWCVILSIGFYGGLEALKFVGSGGGHKIEGLSGHVLSDRNELSVAFVMTLPICFYLLSEYGKESKFIRFGLLGLMGLLITAIIGTQSRGGFIALLGLGGYLFAKSERKMLMMVLVVILVGALSSFVSEEWFSRMDTIHSANSDASFMGRVVAWKLSFILAVNNPLLGGGFKSLEYFPVWTSLSKEFYSYSFFYSGDAIPDQYIARAAHSVYFQVLGEHGFVGLFFYLGILVLSFRKAGALATRARLQGAPSWIATLGTMLQLSIFSFCLGGAALSFAYFDLIFAIHGIVVVLESRILPDALKSES